MMSVQFSAFLLAGIGTAGLALALHLLRRRPPDRRPLPTARFLDERPRTLLRFQRIPDNLPLLLVRMAFALALGAAFSGLSWTERRVSHGHVILLDAAPHPGSDWDQVRAVAERAAREAGASAVVAYGYEDGYRVVDAAALSSLPRGERPTTFEDGLRALRDATLSTLPLASVEASWVTRPSWTAWTHAFGLLRPALWPGSVRVPLWPTDAAQDTATSPEPGPQSRGWVARVEHGDRENEADGTAPPSALVLGLRALGFQTLPLDTDSEGTGTSGATVIFEKDPGSDLPRLIEAARSGATVVVSGAVEVQDNIFPWRTADLNRSNGPTGNIVVNPRVTLRRSVDLFPGRPSDQVATTLVLEDATPAAVARSVGPGCLVYSAVDLSDTVLTAETQYPSLLARLVDGCLSDGFSTGPLDTGATETLSRTDLPARVPVPSLGVPRGIPLSRWCALASLVLLVAEVAMTRRKDA